MMKNLAKFFCRHTGIPDYWVKSTVFELRMMLVRIYARLPYQNYKIWREFKKNKTINLLFGCGSTKYAEWYGVDCFFSKNVDFVLDLRQKIPFKNNSVSLCYSEHFMEHLSQSEALAHLCEVHRILKPGGRYRIVVPAAFRFIERYQANDAEFFALAFPWAERNIDAVRDIIYFSGAHKNVYDFSELKFMAKKTGFNSVFESSANGSSIFLMKIDKVNPQRVAESLYVEMLKDI